MTADYLKKLRSSLSELTATELTCLDDVAAPWSSWLPCLRGLPLHQVHAAVADAAEATYPEECRLWFIAGLHCWMMSRRHLQPWILYRISDAPELHRCVSLLKELESALQLHDPRAVLTWNAVEGAVHCCLLTQYPVSVEHSVVYMVLWLCRPLMAVHASEFAIQYSMLSYLRAVLQNSPLQLQERLSDNLNSDLIPGMRRSGKSPPIQPGGIFLPALQEGPVALQDVYRDSRSYTLRTSGHCWAESSSAQEPQVAPSAALYGDPVEIQDVPGNDCTSAVLAERRLPVESPMQQETNVAGRNLVKLEYSSGHEHDPARSVAGHSLAASSSIQECEVAVSTVLYVNPGELQIAHRDNSSPALLTQAVHLTESQKEQELLLYLRASVLDDDEELQDVPRDDFKPASGVAVPLLGESLLQQGPDVGVRVPLHDPVELQGVSRHIDLNSSAAALGLANSSSQRGPEITLRNRNRTSLRKSQTSLRKSQTSLRKSQTSLRKSQTSLRKSQTSLRKSQT
ncbi:hypothetical protein V5799_025815 [Amblyomma americanum]|uniref:Uncharacterized protein n=1 Tax=Amblyomma americanum TaxID=6943 RepID=A0AAQ4E864_AMBAM